MFDRRSLTPVVLLSHLWPHGAFWDAPVCFSGVGIAIVTHKRSSSNKNKLENKTKHKKENKQRRFDYSAVFPKPEIFDIQAPQLHYPTVQWSAYYRQHSDVVCCSYIIIMSFWSTCSSAIAVIVDPSAIVVTSIALHCSCHYRYYDNSYRCCSFEFSLFSWLIFWPPPKTEEWESCWSFAVLLLWLCDCLCCRRRRGNSCCRCRLIWWVYCLLVHGHILVSHKQIRSLHRVVWLRFRGEWYCWC